MPIRLESFSERIKAFVSSIPSGTWITGGDWDHENWGGELPHLKWIDAFTPNNPVWINRLDGHMALANTAALKAAGITEKVTEVSGGTIGRSPDGSLSGIFKDNAMSLVEGKIPAPSDDLVDRALDAAMNYVASNGVTSVHHMVGYMDAFERARKENRLRTRIYAMMPLSNWEALDHKIKTEGPGDKWLRIGGLKGFVDGSLGAHTAAFHAPYTDAPEDVGFFINTTEDLTAWVKNADKAGLQIMIHAIGDRAIHTLLNIFEIAATENGSRDRRFRIEHAQHIAPTDIPRFATQKVIASMQPYHAIDDGRWASKVIGPERSENNVCLPFSN